MGDSPPHQDLDRIVDETARAFTALAPPPGLRSRVRDRIARPPRRPVFASRAAAAVAIVAGLAVAQIARHDREAPAPVGSPATPSRGVVPRAEPGLTRQPAGDDAPSPPALPGGSVSGRARAQQPAPAARQSVRRVARFQIAPPDEPADPPFAPLEIPRLAVEPLQRSVLRLQEMAPPVPLQLQRIEIAQLIVE